MTSDSPLPPIDTTVPTSARVYDYLLGGKDNFAADRSVGDAIIAQVPALPLMVRAQRAFLGRAVTFLVKEGNVRQFLDIGTGIPSANNVHEVAQAIAPETRVVYIDNDPIVMAHARALMASHVHGTTEFIQADLREPEAILSHPALSATLDLKQPVGLLLLGILMHLHDEDDPFGIVATLMRRLPSGSYLTIAHPTPDFDRKAMTAVASVAEASGIPYVPRTRADVEKFFTGLELVDPGVVPMLGWHPDEDDTPDDIYSVYAWAGVGRKP
jgi:S-adenosyl methyltransferase